MAALEGNAGFYNYLTTECRSIWIRHLGT